VSINLDPDPQPVNADPSQMDQILMNLAVNARDAMPNGGRLTIETDTVALDDNYCRSHIEATEGPHVLLTITDTGVGIDKASLGRIFEPYYTTKKPGEGTGLGLATVYGIVKGHGGHINCYSEPGVGTTFKIHLPVHRIEMEPDVETSQELPVFGTGTILLVDDEEFVRSLGQRILEKAGYSVITANDGGEAVALYRQKKDEISVVILDLIMPVMDGRESLAEILRIDPGAKVLIASGYSPDGGEKKTLEGGAKGFVGKPYILKDLLKKVREVLEG
jgi:two-component system, cell cycle sensor histidine kinase and response regulator CckA